MIKNERQYRITKSQADKFRQALSQFATSAEMAEMHPVERRIHEDALRSQFDDLQAQLAEYEALRSGKRSVLEVESFAGLPRALIQARIAAGLSQKELAERLSLKEQQIQQYESTEYAAASLGRVREIIDALGIQVREEVFLPSAGVSKAKLLERMRSVGVDRDFILRRILPRPLAARFQETRGAEEGTLGNVVLEAASCMGRVFDLSPSAIFGTAPLQLNTAAVGTARFKMPSRVDERKVGAYTVYAHYLALLAIQATQTLELERVPTDAHAVRKAILAAHGSLTFEGALRYIWGLGIPVLPLTDRGGFHGACWRVGGRNVIVLKQQARYVARWLNDALHELGHAGQKPEETERFVVETGDILQDRQGSDEEEEAQYFAEDTIFAGRAEEIADKCYKQAGHIEGLSRVVPLVAAEAGVPADALAYYVAYSLSLAGKHWWPAATNLQNKNDDPWQVARDVFLEHADLSVLNEADRLLLLQALTDVKEVEEADGGVQA